MVESYPPFIQADVGLESACCKRLFHVFQMFHMYVAIVSADVAKVDRDVAYIVMVAHVRCKLLFPMFNLCFLDVFCNCVYLDVAYVSNICCMCFIRMLRIDAMVFKCVSGVFSSVS